VVPSAALKTCSPAVLNVTDTECTPASAAEKVTSAGSAACASSLVKCAVPR
jgi:hypothetical protein